MTKKYIAIAPKGQEFLHKRELMIAVPSSTAGKIAEALTKIKYHLKDGEIWHVYENDIMSDIYISCQIKRYGNRMKIYNY